MYLSIYVYLSIASLISLSKYMAYYICHVIIIGHVSQYIKLTKRHFSQKHAYRKKPVRVCVFVL